MEYTDEQLDEIKASYRKEISEGMTYSINKFDDQILLISTGALVLSLNFIGDVVTLKAASWLWILYASWIFLVLTSIVSVFTHLDSYRLHGKQLTRLDENLPLVSEDKTTVFRNYAMFFALSLGIILQVLFIIINIQNMKNQNTQANPTISNASITINVPTVGGRETLGAPVMQVPAALRPSNGQSTSGIKQ